MKHELSDRYHLEQALEDVTVRTMFLLLELGPRRLQTSVDQALGLFTTE